MATRQIATEIVLGGEKEFNSAMTAINSNLKTLRTDMAATSAEFDGNADSVDALTAKQKILAETAAQNDAKVDALRQRYEHLKTTLGEDAAATDKAKQALNQAKFLQVGSDIIRGIWNGIKSATEWLYNLLSGWVTDTVDWIKSKFGIASPSKVMEQEVGVWMARGIGEGFKKEMRLVNAQMADAIDTSFDVPQLYGSSRAQNVAVTTAGGKTVNLTIYTQKLTDADISMLLDLVNQKLGDEL